MEIKCKYNSATSIEKIQEVAKENGFVYPKELIDLILKCNNGIITPNKFDSKKEQDLEVKTILSYNKEDIETVYGAIKALKESGFNYIPFANTPSGNLICLNGNEVIVWEHEKLSPAFVSPTLSDFLESLRA